MPKYDIVKSLATFQQSQQTCYSGTPNPGIAFFRERAQMYYMLHDFALDCTKTKEPVRNTRFAKLPVDSLRIKN